MRRVRDWIRRGGLIAFCVAGLLLLLFGPRPHEREAEENVVVIDYWEKWGDPEGAQMQRIVDDFNRTVGAAKGIRVRYLSLSSVHHKTLIAAAAGVPPDVAGLWDGNVAQFASLGALEPLDKLAAEYGIEAEDYKPVYWEACHYDGTLYGLVSTPWAVALHWNKALFEQEADTLRAAGLDPTRPPRTLDELDAYAAALDVIAEDGSIERTGFLPLHPGWFLPYMPYWFGGEVYDPARDRLTLDTPEAVRAYTWIESYADKLGVKAMTEFNSGLNQPSSPQSPFIQGTLAMEMQGPWRANYFERLAPHMNRWKMSKEAEAALPHDQRKRNYRWGVAPFPSAVGEERVTFAGFDVLVIPRGARHKREAFAFIAYVNRQRVMEKLCSMHSKNSPLREVSREFIENHPNPYIEVFESLASSPNARSVPPVPVWMEAQQELMQAAQRVYLKRAAPAEALGVAQRRMQSQLERKRAMDRQREAMSRTEEANR